MRGSIGKHINYSNAIDCDLGEVAQALRGLFKLLNVDPRTARLAHLEVGVNLIVNNSAASSKAVLMCGRLQSIQWTNTERVGATATASNGAYSVKIYAKAVGLLRIELRGQNGRMAKLLKLNEYGLHLRYAADLINAATYHSEKLQKAFTNGLMRRIDSLTFSDLGTANEVKAAAAHLVSTTTPHFMRRAPKATPEAIKDSNDSIKQKANKAKETKQTDLRMELTKLRELQKQTEMKIQQTLLEIKAEEIVQFDQSAIDSPKKSWAAKTIEINRPTKDDYIRYLNGEHCDKPLIWGSAIMIQKYRDAKDN